MKNSKQEDRARRKAMGVALVQSPLKFIRSKTDTKTVNAKGETVIDMSEATKMALYSIRDDGGRIVQELAQSVARFE